MGPDKDDDEFICQWYKKLSHYTLVKDLMNSTEFGLQTTDFTIRWKSNHIIISFLTTQARDQFKRFYKEFSGIYYYEKLNQNEFDFRQWIQKKSTRLKRNKMNYLKTEAESAANTEDDDDIIFQE